MIREGELYAVGRTLKPHGINGEISATIDRDIDIDALRCIVFEIDGIFVPFFISSYRQRGSEAVLLTIDGITDERNAAELCGMTVYGLRTDVDNCKVNDDNEGFYVSDLIGYTLFDSEGLNIGVVTGYDDSTANTLLLVDSGDTSPIMVPIADDLIEDFDTEHKIITINMPEGLLDL